MYHIISNSCSSSSSSSGNRATDWLHRRASIKRINTKRRHRIKHLMLITIALIVVTIGGYFTAEKIVLPQIRPRKFAHSVAEIDLTKHVPLIDSSPCRTYEIPILISTAAVSSGSYYRRRKAIRETWAPAARSAGFRPLFFLGRPTSGAVQRAIERESAKFGDIIQFDFVDAYFNLTLKLISELRWAHRNCPLASFVIKTDDDSFWNVPVLARFIAEREFPADKLVGYKETSKTNRNPWNKWYKPETQYPAPQYTQLYGLGIVFPRVILKKIISEVDLYSGPFVDIDDLLITSIIAERLNIPRRHSCRFSNSIHKNDCQLATTLVVSPDHPIDDEYRRWNRTHKRYEHLISKIRLFDACTECDNYE